MNNPASQKQLQKNVAIFRTQLSQLNIPTMGTTYIVPIIIGDNNKAVEIATQLQEKNIQVMAIRPPSVPPNTARLRFSIRANHTERSLIQTTKDLHNALSMD